MHRLALSSLALLTSLLAFDVGAAVADTLPAERGSVRDHRSERSPGVERRYRRRPGPRFMMPLKIDLGMQGANTSMGYLPGVELRAGVHWASLSPQPTNFDIGVGVFGAVLVGPTNDAMPDAETDVLYGGGYVELGQTLSRGDWWRTWGAARGEYLGVSAFGEEQAGFGIAGRLSAELYASGVGIEPRGLFLGTYAVGVYAEAAGRGLGDDVSALQVSAGLTFRTPLVFAP